MNRSIRQRNTTLRQQNIQWGIGLLTLRSIGLINTLGICIVMFVICRTNISILAIRDESEMDWTTSTSKFHEQRVDESNKILSFDNNSKSRFQERQPHDSESEKLEKNLKPRSKFSEQIRRLRDLYPNGMDEDSRLDRVDRISLTVDKRKRITKDVEIKTSTSSNLDSLNKGTGSFQRWVTERTPTAEGTQVSTKQLKKKKHANKIKIDSAPKALTPEELMLAYFSRQKCVGKGDPLPRNTTWLKQVVIQIGVMKGGTKAVHNYLQEHPHFVSRCSKEFAKVELQYFNHKLNQSQHEGTIDRRLIHEGYAQYIEETCPYAVQQLKENTEVKYLDDSPLYIQDSDKVPQLLNCAMPWAKLLAILRNPTERAFSHYNFYLERNWCTEHTFEEWVDLNIAYLNETGVLNATDEYEELLAWNRHNQLEERRCYTFVSRGLYAIQVYQYMMALIAGGRPATDLMVIHSEGMQLKGDGSERQKKYEDILSFLGLPPFKLMQNKTVHKTVYVTEMKSDTRAKLDEFYKPYNHRLYDLLDWDHVWH